MLLLLTACTGSVAGNQAAQAQPEQPASTSEQVEPGGGEVTAGQPHPRPRPRKSSAATESDRAVPIEF